MDETITRRQFKPFTFAAVFRHLRYTSAMLARLIGALPMAQRLQLLDMVGNGLEPVQMEAAATEA